VAYASAADTPREFTPGSSVTRTCQRPPDGASTIAMKPSSTVTREVPAPTIRKEELRSLLLRASCCE